LFPENGFTVNYTRDIMVPLNSRSYVVVRVPPFSQLLPHMFTVSTGMQWTSLCLSSTDGSSALWRNI